MIPSVGENYRIEIYKRISNTAYEWEKEPSLICYGKPATQVEIKKYRIQKGVNSSTDSNYVKCSNLPDIVKDGDQVIYLGKRWTIESVGYFYEENGIINARIMSDEYLAKRCPKGITII